MTDLIHELQEAFTEDTAPLVDDLAQTLLSLERAFRDGGEWSQLVHVVRARLHTIKGNAGMVGQTLVVELSHALEDASLLTELPGTEQGTLIDLLLQGTDLLASLIASRPGAGHDPAVSALKQQIAGLSALHGDVHASSQPERDSQEPEARAVARPLLRVDLAILDQLLDGLGEAISAQAALSGGRAERHGTVGDEQEEELHRLGSSLRGMRELLVRARLVPLASLFARFVRPIRDLSRERGLQVDLRHAGGEHAVDKAICDQLAEPLLHLVRNAVAHGIEPVAERVRVGKPATGLINIVARADGDRTIITVQDDGRGLNVTRLRERARELGIDTEQLDDEACLRLALLPRLSTSEQVDELAGRGVGLDAAERAIKALGGSLAVHSRPGQGATFVLELPSSLSLLKGLVVRLGRERFILPLGSLVQTFRVTPDMLHELNGRRVVRWKQLVPWLDLGALLGVKREAGRGEHTDYAALVHTGTSVRALGVDAVLGGVETIVKPLQSELTSLACVTGAAVLGDGGIALILNPRGLSERSGQGGSLGAHHA